MEEQARGGRMNQKFLSPLPSPVPGHRSLTPLVMTVEMLAEVGQQVAVDMVTLQ